MRLLAARITAVLLGLSLAACLSGKSSLPDYPKVESAELGTMRNVSRSGDIWFGGVPSPEDLDLARRRGIERVVNLCTPDQQPEYAIDREIDALGFKRVDVQLISRTNIPDDVVTLVVRALGADEIPRTLIFCGDGSRSAMFFAIHRVLNEGVPLEEALVEARSSGMRAGDPEEFVRQQVARLQAQR